MKFSEHKEKKKKGMGINFMILFAIFLFDFLLDFKHKKTTTFYIAVLKGFDFKKIIVDVPN